MRDAAMRFSRRVAGSIVLTAGLLFGAPTSAHAAGCFGTIYQLVVEVDNSLVILFNSGSCACNHALGGGLYAFHMPATAANRGGTYANALAGLMSGKTLQMVYSNGTPPAYCPIQRLDIYG